MPRIKKVAVIGAGTMGGGIAAHAANAGCAVVLLDVAPSTLTPEETQRGLTLASKAVRNRIVATGLERVKKSRPAALFSPQAAERIQIGNLEDDLGLIADADWIIEVIIEQLSPKQELMARIEAIRKPGSIVSSNTSGIPIAQIAAGRSVEFRQHFLGTHFFNPPRYLHLLEVIPTPDTLPAVVEQISNFADESLGKGVIVAKDSPNFIGNRIFSYAMQLRTLYALEHGYRVEEVDNLTGELIGNPKTATFRLLDLVGLDVANHVTANLYQAVPDDEEREIFRIPEPLKVMAERGWLGNKTGIGFYQQQKGAAGKEFWPLDLQTMEHVAPTKVRFDLVGQARKIEDVRERLRFLFAHATTDRAGIFLRDTNLRILGYTARRIPEISDSILDIDRAMRWGFSQQLGPFEMWDAFGVRAAAEAMRELDIPLAPWVEQMLAQGNESFYQYDGRRVIGVYDPASGDYRPYAPPVGVISLDDLRAQGQELARNDSASLIALGDGVLCLEFHSKVNAIDPLIVEMGYRALEMLKQPQFVGLVIGNQANDFCAGVNLALVMATVANGQAEEVAKFTRSTQQLYFRFRTSPKPIVAAPYGRVLGGGAELTMQASRRVAAAETYIGLVELGVGLIPGWGGCKEFVRRHVSPALRQNPYADPLPLFQQAFETIAMAKVSESAEQARQFGFLDANDRIVMNKDRLLAAAKAEVLRMLEAGYQPPPPTGEPIYAIGRRGIAAVETQIHAMQVGGYVSDYDVQLAKALAYAMSGGPLTQPQWVSEQYLYDLEFEQISQLIQQPKTQERIVGMLQTGKPVRN